MHWLLNVYFRDNRLILLLLMHIRYAICNFTHINTSKIFSCNYMDFCQVRSIAISFPQSSQLAAKMTWLSFHFHCFWALARADTISETLGLNICQGRSNRSPRILQRNWRKKIHRHGIHFPFSGFWTMSWGSQGKNPSRDEDRNRSREAIWRAPVYFPGLDNQPHPWNF